MMLLEPIKPWVREVQHSFRMELSENLLSSDTEPPALHLQPFLSELFVLVVQPHFIAGLLPMPFKLDTFATFLTTSDLLLVLHLA